LDVSCCVALMSDVHLKYVRCTNDERFTSSELYVRPGVVTFAVGLRLPDETAFRPALLTGLEAWHEDTSHPWRHRPAHPS
jgi:hypothetical protein